MFFNRVTFGLVLVLSLPVISTATEMPYGWNVTNGFRNQAKVEYVRPIKDTKQLTLTNNEPSVEVKRILDELFSKNNAKALLVAQDTELIYEKYSFGVGKRNTPLGYSMSKSLTAITVGRAICEGHITSIDDALKKYVPALGGTSWGEASVRDVLRMSSGAYSTVMALNGHKSRELEQSIGSAVHEGRMNFDFGDLMKAADERQLQAGTVFNYNNFDTIALGLLVQGATGISFPAYFEKAVWHSVGPEYRGAWFMNNKEQASTYQGFSASPHDWIRIGVMVLRELKNQDTCFGKFLKDATSKQISSFGPATSYGYQIWVSCGNSSDFCFVGFGGQYLLFNVETDTVLYHHATTFSSVVWSTPFVMGKLAPLLKQSIHRHQ